MVVFRWLSQKSNDDFLQKEEVSVRLEVIYFSRLFEEEEETILYMK